MLSKDHNRSLRLGVLRNLVLSVAFFSPPVCSPVVSSSSSTYTPAVFVVVLFCCRIDSVGFSHLLPSFSLLLLLLLFPIRVFLPGSNQPTYLLLKVYKNLCVSEVGSDFRNIFSLPQKIQNRFISRLAFTSWLRQRDF